MLTCVAQIVLFTHGAQCLVGRQAAIQAAPGSITSKRTAADPGSLHQATTATASRFHHGRLDLDRKEDDMTGTPNPACPLCGLRFGSRPLLDLHIREDHRQRGHRNPGDTRYPCRPPAAHLTDPTWHPRRPAP
jgi:hypothetical protein